jgi:Ca-activated chloride channel family protein
MRTFRPAAPSTPWVRAAGTLAVAVLLLAPTTGQTPKPTVRILEPLPGSFPGDPIVIRAAIEPESTAVERLEFFGDARLICTVTEAPFECAWYAGSEIRGHAVRVVAVLGGGGRVATQIRTADPGVSYSVDVTRVRLTVVVKSGDKFVRGLPRSAFRVFEDDEPQPIEYFGSVSESSLELVTAVDISDSMADAIGQVKVLVKRFLGSIRETDRVRAVAFNENYFPLPATDRAGLLRDVDLLAPWGMTALYDTILRCFDLLGKQPSRLAMVVFTDGEDTASRATAEAVERRADASDAVLYMIGQGQAVNTPQLKALCERLAQRSGGRAFFPRRIEDLGGTFDQILEELSNQYLLTYMPPREDDKWHRIRVKVAGYSDDQVRTKQGRQRESSSIK